MNRKSRASIAVVTATVLIGAGATAVANAVASSQAAKDAVSVESSAPKDTTAGTQTADLERSVNDLLARLSGLQAAVAAGAHGPGTPSPAETSEAVGASVETPVRGRSEPERDRRADAHRLAVSHEVRRPGAEQLRARGPQPGERRHR